MRTSADRNDPGFMECHLGRWLITVDGREAKGCVTADEEKGIVVLLAVNDEGNCYADNSTGELVKFEYHGVVKIRERSDWQPEQK